MGEIGDYPATRRVVVSPVCLGGAVRVSLFQESVDVWSPCLCDRSVAAVSRRRAALQ
jgi:hypothetical protein